MKRVLTNTIIIVLVGLAIFAPVFLLMLHTLNNNQKNYVSEIKGEWQAFQYYDDAELLACNNENWLTLSVTDTDIVAEGTLLPNANVKFTKLSGTALSYQSGGKTVVLHLSYDALNNLKITIEGTSQIIFLQRKGE